MEEEQKQAFREKVLNASEAFPRLQIVDLEAVEVRDARIFDPGVLVEGCCHQLVAPYESGKTFLSLACAKEFLVRGLKVLYLDHENRSSSIKKRLQVLGVSEKDRNNLLYVNHPNLDLSKDSRNQWISFLKHQKPDLVIFDSQIGFMSNAGKDENSSNGFSEWANVYLEIPKVLGMTTLVIDHTGWYGSWSRGTSGKPGQYDIIWKAKVKKKFSTGKVGQIELKLAKNRDSLVPYDCLSFEIGGNPFQFVADATVTKSSELSDDQEKALSLVSRNSKNGIGTMRKSINELFNMSKSKANTIIESLLVEDLIYQPEGSKLYWTKDSSTDSSGSTESPENSNQGPELVSSVDAVNGEGVLGSRSFRTGPMDPAPRTNPASSLKENIGNTLEEGENHTVSRGEKTSPKEYGESNVVLDEKDLMEATSALGYPEKETEILQTIALIAWHDPSVFKDAPGYSSKDMQDKIISLAEIEGVEVSEKNYEIALWILVNKLAFAKILKERMRRVG